MSLVQHGIVSAVNPDSYTITIVRNSACSQCAGKDTCLTLEQKPHWVKISRSTLDGGYGVGDRVRLEMTSARFLLAASLVYLGPVVLMVVGAVLPGLFQTQVTDGVRSVYAFAGLALGFIFAWLIQPLFRKRKSFEATMQRDDGPEEILCPESGHPSAQVFTAPAPRAPD